MSPPRVVMVTGAYYPEISGAGLQCRTLIHALGADADITVLTTTTDRSLPTVARINDTPVYRIYVEPRSLVSVASAGCRLFMFWLRNQNSFDIVHLHGFSKKTILVSLLAKLSGKRILLKLTSVGHDDPMSARQWAWLSRFCYGLPDRLVGVSPRFQALADAAGLYRDQFTLIPNGVDLERFHPCDDEERSNLRASLGLPPDLPLILFVGFFSREKHPDLLFDAWLRAGESSGIDSALIFIGTTRSSYYEVDPSIASAIRSEAAQRNLQSRLYFVERAEAIERYYRCADLFVLPSSREGLPNALIEAMASGLACIASRLPGVTDAMIEDGVSGTLVPPRDAEALAKSLQGLLCDPHRRKTLGQEARRRAIELFPMSKTALRHLALYRELINARKLAQKESVKAAFAARADSWQPQYDCAKDFRRYCFDTRRREVLELLDSGLQGHRVLDAGCATGDYLEPLLERGHTVYAMDVSPAMVERVRRRFAATRPAQLQIVEADIEKMPYEDATFEGIVCAGVLEYLPTDEGALQEMNRVLVAGGLAVITVPNILSPFVWVDRAAYAAVRLAGATLKAVGLFERLAGKPRTTTIFRHRAYVPSRFDRTLKRHGFLVKDRRYGWFGSFALNNMVPGAVPFSKSCERFSRRPWLGWLGMCYIVRVKKL